MESSMLSVVAGLQATFSTVSMFLQVLHEGCSPAWHQATQSAFWKSVQDAFSNFLTFTPAAGSAGEAAILHGAAAAGAIMAGFVAKRATDNNAKFAFVDLSPLVQFRWLLTKEHSAMLDLWKNESLVAPKDPGPELEQSMPKKVSKKNKGQDMKALVGSLFK
jgi:hypothetical protein